MGAAFSSKSTSKAKGPVINEVDKAILSLKAQRKKLGDQQKLLEVRIDRHAEVARLLVNEKKKDRALLVLKRKKLVEHQLQQLGGLLVNVEQMINNVELQKQQNQLFSVLKQGNDALKQLQSEVSVEDVQRLMDDTAEAKAYQDEVSAALSQSLTGEDEAEVEAELAALESVVADAEALEMPKVPSSKVPEAQGAAVSPAKQAHEAEAGQEEEEAEETPKEAPLLAS